MALIETGMELLQIIFLNTRNKGLTDEMECKKYLFYDDMIRGGGLGHALGCYSYGIKMAIDKDMVFLPHNLILGHGVGSDGIAENSLGLPLCSNARKYILEHFPEEVEHIKYDAEKWAPVTCLGGMVQGHDKEAYYLVRKVLWDYYKYRRFRVDNILKGDVVNIAISIRRGEVALPNEGFSADHPFRKRLRSEGFYLNAVNKIIKDKGLGKYHIHILSDGDWSSEGYIDKEGNGCDIYEAFKSHLPNASYFPTRQDGFRTITQLQTAVDADIFVGSISGFSDLIALYRGEKETYLPSNESEDEFYKLDWFS